MSGISIKKEPALLEAWLVELDVVEMISDHATNDRPELRRVGASEETEEDLWSADIQTLDHGTGLIAPQQVSQEVAHLLTVNVFRQLDQASSRFIDADTARYLTGTAVIIKSLPVLATTTVAHKQDLYSAYGRGST